MLGRFVGPESDGARNRKGRTAATRLPHNRRQREGVASPFSFEMKRLVFHDYCCFVPGFVIVFNFYPREVETSMVRTGDTHDYPFHSRRGTGSRLWPLSRAQHPKQFHAFDKCGAVARRHRPPGSESSKSLCAAVGRSPTKQNRFGVSAAFKSAKSALQGIVLEPVGRSTAPAAAVAAHLALEKAGRKPCAD